LAQEFEHIKIWHLMSQNYISLLISCILYDLILLNFILHAIFESMCLLNYVELCPLNLLAKELNNLILKSFLKLSIF